MKRIVISILIVGMLISLAFISAWQVDRVTNEMLVMFDRAEKENSIADYAMLSVTLEEIEQYYEKNSWILFLFLRRDYVTNPQCSFCVLQAYANEENAADFATELLRAKMQIHQLRALFFSIA